MPQTRQELIGAAQDLRWNVIDTGQKFVDVYRCEPYSIMVTFSRDGMVTDAMLFTDPPDARQQLPPRVLAECHKFDANKYRRIRSWLYDYKQAA